jgi:hypothetical protein
MSVEIRTKRGYVAFVDDEDASLALKRWTAVVIKRKNGTSVVYCGRWERTPEGKKKFVYLHQMVCPCSPGFMPDHKDGDGLNNRRDNLRPANKSMNTANGCAKGGTSRFRGVCWDKRAGKWLARVSLNGKAVWSGLFVKEADAATAYNLKAAEVFGEFARFNSVDGGSNLGVALLTPFQPAPIVPQNPAIRYL